MILFIIYDKKKKRKKKEEEEKKIEQKKKNSVNLKQANNSGGFTKIKTSPSEETNCPTASEPPPPDSTNSTSETMMLSSSTEPQPMQTASPRAASTSMSELPQCLHTLELMLPHSERGLQCEGREEHYYQMQDASKPQYGLHGLNKLCILHLVLISKVLWKELYSLQQ